MTTAGLGFYGLAAYLAAFTDERGFSVGAISFASTTFFLASGATGLVVARTMAKRDVRQIVVFGAVVGAIALVLLGRATQVWHVYLIYVVFAVGFACAGLVPATTVVTRWFQVKRSMAISVASTGLSVGGVLITPFAKQLIDAHGLEASTPWLGLVWLVGIVPITLLLMKPDPGALGWQPDGERMNVLKPATTLTGMPFETAKNTRFFRMLAGAYLLIMGAQVGGIQQLVKLVQERVDRPTAALATSVLAFSSIVARLLAGRIVGRINMPMFTASLAALQGVALLLLGLSTTKATLLGAAVLFGLTVGNLLMLQPLLIAEAFGVRDYPRLYSRSQFISTLGVAGGPFLLGVLHDRAGGYRPAYMIAAGLSTIGALILAAAGGFPQAER